MLTTIAILGKNSAWILRYTLRIVKQAIVETAGKFEILYIDGGSSDGSPQLVKKILPEAQVIDATNTNIPEARNIAVRQASGDYIIFWDSDVIAPTCVLRTLLLLRQKASIVALTRYDITISSEADIEKLLASPPDCKSEPIRQSDFAVFSINLFHRRVFNEVGLFDERMTQAEDREFGLRASCKGYKTLVIPTPAYDINKPKISDVPITTPLRQYLRGIHKKALIYAYTATPRQKINTALFATIHTIAILGSMITPLAALSELVPAIAQVKKYGFNKGLEMYIKALTLYTAMASIYPLKLTNICRWLKPPKTPCTQ
ncbi:MAG: glycosyltransferase family 2 protein [Infirmifilum sp.]